MQKGRNAMITDEQLRIAAAEYTDAFLRSLSDLEECHHEFSAGFERKMQKLIRRQRHLVRYRVLRTAMAAVLAAVILFGAAMAVSPKVRAAVIRWLQENVGIFSHYCVPDAVPTVPAKNAPELQFNLPKFPEGYELVQTDKMPDGTAYIYKNPAGQMAKFRCILEGSDVHIDKVNYEHQTVMIGSVLMDIYLPRTEGENGEIVWADESQDLLFQISCLATKDELIEMAKSVIVH